MKLFEIGDGLKSISVPDKYYSDWEDEQQTVILYTADENTVYIRISVLSIAPKDESKAINIQDTVAKNAKEEGYVLKIKGDKSYYGYHSDSLEEGNVTYIYEVGYLDSYIIFSVTVPLEDKENVETKNALSDVEEMIETIATIYLKRTTIFEPKYADYKEVYERVSEVLNIQASELDALHEKNRTVPLIQEILDEELYSKEQTYELQSLGLALGDYIQYQFSGFKWGIVRDEYGRDLCLNHQEQSIVIFPLTMISKRIEDGEFVSVQHLVDTLSEIVNDAIDDNNENDEPEE